MVDVTDFSVDPTSVYTHIVSIEGEDMYVSIPNPDILIEVLKDARSNDYHIFEVISEVHIPFVSFSGDSTVALQCFQSLMKRMYNSFRPVALLSNLDSNIVCAPDARVSKEMQKEIDEVFKSLCDYRSLNIELESRKTMPLTWNISVYKDTSEIDEACLFEDEPSNCLSTMITEQPLSSKIKSSISSIKKNALIDSILMQKRTNLQGDKEKAKELMPLISSDRCRDMSTFLVIGRCLYTIFHGDEEGLELWRQYTLPEQQSLCDSYYPDLDTTSTYYRIYTLQYWASLDSPKEYKEWNSTSIQLALESSVLATGGILDIAQVAYRKNPTLFICHGDDAREAEFFCFNGTYYKPCGLFTVQKYIQDEILPEFETYLSDLSKLADSNPQSSGGEQSFSEMMAKKISKCIKIITDLKKPAFQKSIIDSLMILYNKPGFDNIRDSNPYLTAFEDCVFDAEKQCIRDGIPEDNITCSTEYPFLSAWKEYNWDHPDVKTVLENLEKIIHDEEKREVLRRENASLLYACNLLKRGLIVHGATNNAKSALYTWISKAFGPTYCPDIPNNLLYCSDMHPGNASPQFEMARFARLALQSEVDDSMTLNEALFKRWTGGTDKITYRGLYQKKIRSFTPSSTPVTICNTFPKLNGNSAALRTRLLVITLDSKFITEKDPEYEQLENLSPEERQDYMSKNHWYWADPQFGDVIKRTYKAFMWVLIQDYIKYSGKKADPCDVPCRQIPPGIITDTRNYLIKSNIFMQFLKAAIRRDPTAPGVSTYVLYNAYKKWYADTISRYGFAPYGKFKDELEAMNIRSHNDMYSGIIVTYNTY